MCPIVVSVYKTSAKTCTAVLRQFLAGGGDECKWKLNLCSRSASIKCCIWTHQCFYLPSVCARCIHEHVKWPVLIDFSFLYYLLLFRFLRPSGHETTFIAAYLRLLYVTKATFTKYVLGTPSHYWKDGFLKLLLYREKSWRLPFFRGRDSSVSIVMRLSAG
jgi:hypothetical protein